MELIYPDWFNNPFTIGTSTPTKIYVSLIRLMVERQFLLAVTFIFPVLFLVPHKAALFMTSLSTVLRHQPLFLNIILLVISVLLKKKELSREEDITVILEVTVTEGCPMEGDASREPFGF